MAVDPGEPNKETLGALYETTGSDPVFVQSLVDLYSHQVDNFRRDTASGTPAEIGSSAHSLAGASLTLGLDDLAQSLLDVEHGVADNGRRLDDAEDLLASLSQAIQSLTEWVGTLPTADAPTT